MAVLVDVSQVLIAAASIGFNSQGADLTEAQIRSMFLNSIKSIKSKHVSQYGAPLVLAFDGKGYWRKDKFEFYKFKRAAGRSESPMNWDIIFGTLNKIYDELKDNFAYHIIKVDGAEADDVISIMAQYFNENELKWEGVMEEKQKVLIVSADKDFIQLQCYDNVVQYSPMQKKFIRESDPVGAKYEKIIRGDSGDGIVNIFSASDSIATGTRQVAATQKKVLPILTSLKLTNKLPADLDPTIVKNYERNKMLIDLVDLQLPPGLKEEILNQYHSVDNSDKGKGLIYSYLIKHNLKNLIKDIDKF